jgi:hypothetical protein
MTTTVNLTVLILAREIPLIELERGAKVERPSVFPPEDLEVKIWN